MDKIYKIYKCTNNINGKSYIGFTNKTLSKRIIEHKCHSNKGSNYLLHKSMRKYGFENFMWETLFESMDKDYILKEMENFFIKEYNTYFENGYGYNMTFGGQGGMLGKTHSEKTKQKLKTARSNRKIEPMLGKKHSFETKEKMSLAKTGIKKDDSYKKMCSNQNKKRYLNPENRKILSEAIKLSWQKRKQKMLGAQN